MSERETSVAGSFYPANCEEIKTYIRQFESQAGQEPEPVKARAIIAPHAGYVYSGYTANMAYRRVRTEGIRRVIVIGPSHRVYLRGASISMHECYASPCGSMPVDQVYAKRLLERYDYLQFYPAAHREHSTETQVPFIQHYFTQVELVEIVYGEIDHTELVPLIHQALQEEESFVVISTDLSHFHELNEANALDRVCLEGITQMDVAQLNRGCEACGMTGVKALLQAASSLGLKSEVMDYRTSYDGTRDASSVVGYLSACIFSD